MAKPTLIGLPWIYSHKLNTTKTHNPIITDCLTGIFTHKDSASMFNAIKHGFWVFNTEFLTTGVVSPLRTSSPPPVIVAVPNQQQLVESGRCLSVANVPTLSSISPFLCGNQHTCLLSNILHVLGILLFVNLFLS
jgi:hypothetical protein